MNYTTEDLNNLQLAKMTLATGASVVEVTVGGKTVRYQKKDRAMIDEMISSAQVQLGLSHLRVYAKNGGRG